MSCVTVTRCDVGSPEEAAQLARRAGPPLRQIWHAGGLLQDATLPNQSLASLRAVAAPKLDGVLRLSAAAAQLPLDAVALFSSTAALLGPPGQGNYAAANAQLNAWSQGRQAAGACSRWTSWWV
jgi:NAD(P)-dependent dehydrogenase (short-subunit alcohol dehydrogenase family)